MVWPELNYFKIICIFCVLFYPSYRIICTAWKRFFWEMKISHIFCITRLHFTKLVLDLQANFNPRDCSLFMTGVEVEDLLKIYTYKKQNQKTNKCLHSGPCFV